MIFKDYFDIKNFTKEEKRKLKTKTYLILTIVVWAILMIAMIVGPVADRYRGNYSEQVLAPTVIITEQEQEQEEEPEAEIKVDINEIHAEMLARLAWGEARGCTKTEQAAVMWCVLNRVDSVNFRDTIATVITQPNQFHYSYTFPLEDDLLDLAYDVLTRWYMEKETGELDSGRVLPKEYCWFGGDGKRNWFRDAYKFKDANIWDWSLDSPYEE